jgi:hypothetical protein
MREIHKYLYHPFIAPPKKLIYAHIFYRTKYSLPLALANG